MKKLKILIALVVIGFCTNAQNIKEDKGLYYVDNELASGDIITYFDNDQVKMEMKVSEGMKDGEMKIFFADGSLNEIRSYKNNQMNGLWITFNTSGIKVAQANFKNGKKHGAWKVYSDEGALVYEMYYQNGQKVGTWKKYNPEGNVIETKTYNAYYNIEKNKNDVDAFVFAS